MAAQITKLTATISSGQSVSTAVNTGGNYVVGLGMPAAWTPARVSVLVSVDNITYNDLFNFLDDMSSTTATEFMFNVIPGTMVAVDPDSMLMARYIKFRSGTRDTPISQAAARVFTVLTVNALTVTQFTPEMADETDSDQSV